MKRAYNIKDFGTSLGAHGGFVDRFDCQVILTTFAVLLLKYAVFKEERDIKSIVSMSQGLDVQKKQEILDFLQGIIQ